MVKHYKELQAWQKAMELARAVYGATSGFPDTERFGLVSQMRRAAVSVPSNIAEGQGRASTGEFRQFLGHARGSLFEVETQMLLAADLGHIGDNASMRLQELIDETGRLLNGLLRSLKETPARPS